MRARSALHAQRLSSVDTCIVAQIPTVTKIEPYFNQNWFSEPFCDQFWLTKPFLNHFWSYFGSGAAARNHEPPPSVIINSSATRASSGFLSSPIYDSWLCLYSNPLPHRYLVRQGAVASLHVARSLLATSRARSSSNFPP